MSPYKIRYYRTPSPDSDYYDRKYKDYDYDYRRRRRRDYENYDYRDDRKNPYYYYYYDAENDSTYGESVYEQDSDYYARRVRSPPPRRRPNYHYHHNRKHHHHHRPHHHHHHHHHVERPRPHRTSASYDHHIPHIHYISARSEPPMRYTPVHPQRLEVTMLKSLPEPQTAEPRIAILDKRHKPHKHSHPHYNHCNACPEKSSKAIPTMHYDELRCPHCAAHVQPAQDEILAYPWTVQSYRPAKKSRSLPPLSNGQASQVTGFSGGGGPPTVLTYKSPERKKRSIVERETQSLVAPTKPLFRNDTGGPSKTEPRVLKEGYERDARDGSYVSKTQQRAGPTTVVSSNRGNRGNDFDEIKPNDSISNVELPPLRAQSNELRRQRQGPRAETEVDHNYTRERYFRSLEENPPPQAKPTPRPQHDTASKISRMLKGEYYDRLNGQKYTYNVNYARRKVFSDRQPQR